MRRLALAAAVVAVSVPALAQTADPRYDPNKVICKSSTMTGSRLVTERICMTRRQWNDLSTRTQDRHEEVQEQGRRMNAPRG